MIRTLEVLLVGLAWGDQLSPVHCVCVSVSLLSRYDIDHPGLDVMLDATDPRASRCLAHLVFSASRQVPRTWWLPILKPREGDATDVNGASGSGEHGLTNPHHVLHQSRLPSHHLASLVHLS